MTSQLEPRRVVSYFSGPRVWPAVDSNTFKNSMLAAAQALVIQLLERSTTRWVYNGKPNHLEHALLLQEEGSIEENRGGFTSAEDMMILHDGPKQRYAVMGRWMGQDLYLLLLRDLIEQGRWSGYNRGAHRLLLNGVDDAVELLSHTYVAGQLQETPDWEKGEALARLLANWKRLPKLTVGKPAHLTFNNVAINWTERMAYDAAARRLEDELLQHDFRGMIHLYPTDKVVVLDTVRFWQEHAFIRLYGEDQQLTAATAIVNRFFALLEEELARPYEVVSTHDNVV